MTPQTPVAAEVGRQVDRKDALVITAASVGTIFEWYDFYLYGSLVSFIGAQFFTGVNETTSYIFALLAFAAGFFVRPFGALVFGRLGDLWGRKNTFLVTMLIMGISTAGVAFLPNYKQIGIWAPIILVGFRLAQGLALGGEYGGAATYVAEHAPHGKRGLYTSWIQTTATGGLLLSLVVILITRTSIGEDAFKAWGWRIPFGVSVLLLLVSLWIRLQLNESPAFKKMIAEGKGSKKPLADSFTKPKNLRLVILALFGLTAGQGVVWYTGQFYALSFLEKTLKVDNALTYQFVALSLLIATPFFVLFGFLSDKIGRKPIIMLGLFLAAATYFPLFSTLTKAANPDLAAATASSPVTVIADPATCALQFDPVGKSTFESACDVAKSALVKAGVSYANRAAAPGAPVVVQIGAVVVPSLDVSHLPKADKKAKREATEKAFAAALKKAGYPAKADPAKMDKPLIIAILAVLVIYVTMVYGPIAAALVEFFPTNIRYTSMSLPYHIGNGWFGGFLPAIAFAMVAANGNMFYGLYYPVAVAVITLGIGLLFVKETKDVDIHA